MILNFFTSKILRLTFYWLFFVCLFQSVKSEGMVTLATKENKNINEVLQSLLQPKVVRDMNGK